MEQAAASEKHVPPGQRPEDRAGWKRVTDWERPDPQGAGRRHRFLPKVSARRKSGRGTPRGRPGDALGTRSEMCGYLGWLTSPVLIKDKNILFCLRWTKTKKTRRGQRVGKDGCCGAGTSDGPRAAGGAHAGSPRASPGSPGAPHRARASQAPLPAATRRPHAAWEEREEAAGRNQGTPLFTIRKVCV